MPSLEKVCAMSDVPKGTMKGFTVQEQEVLVAHTEAGFFAVQARCGHMKAYLPDGTLTGDEVKCPKHGARFDVTTGKVVKGPAWLIEKLTLHSTLDLKRYEVRVREEWVYVRI